MTQVPSSSRYYTADGLPPSSGVPFNSIIRAPSATSQPGPSDTQAACPKPSPRRYYTTDDKPPNQGLPINENSNESSNEGSNERALCMLLNHLRLHMQSQAPTTTKPDDQASKDTLGILRQDVLHLFPEKHVNLRFLYEGQRPCDYKGLWNRSFAYQHVKLPLYMTVGEMVRRLGNPGRGLQEMVELILPRPQGTVFGAGQMLNRTGPTAAKTLQEIGWDETRDENDPVWVVVGPYWA